MPAKINDGLTNWQRFLLRHPEREAQRRYRQRNREKLRRQNEEYRKKTQDKARAYYLANREKLIEKNRARYHKTKDATVEQRRASSARYAAELKEAAINIYSNGLASCARCGNADMDVLCLDHINNDGSAHRKSMRTTTYAWLNRHDYPPGFQVLCMNCNWKKHLQRRANVCI